MMMTMIEAAYQHDVQTHDCICKCTSHKWN